MDRPSSKNVKIEVVLGWLVLLAFTFPLFKQHVGLAFEQLFTIFLFGVCVFLISRCELQVSRAVPLVLLIVFVFIALTSLSLIISSSDIVNRDVIELIKPLYLGSFFLVSYLCKWNYTEFNRFLSITLISFLVISVWGVLEANVPIINDIAKVIYKDSRGSLNFKAVGPFIVPYVFGSLIILPIWYFLLATLYQKNRLVNFVAFCVCFAALLYTQSRTIILSFGATLIYFILLALFTRWLPKRNLVIFTIYAFGLLSAGVLVVYYNEIRALFGYMVKGLEVVYSALVSGGLDAVLRQQPSVGLRYEQLMFAVDAQFIIPLIGVGIGKALFMPESFYALYLYRYGLIGIVIHGYLIFCTWYMSIKLARALRSAPSSRELSFFLAVSAYMASLPVSYVSSSLNDFTRTGFFFYVLLGLIFVLYRRIILGKL